jgi:hypothetical protein
MTLCVISNVCEPWNMKNPAIPWEVNFFLNNQIINSYVNNLKCFLAVLNPSCTVKKSCTQGLNFV